MEARIKFRLSNNADLPGLLAVHETAFGPDEGPEIVDLVVNLLKDPTAKPLLSLVATDENTIVGHILFTKVTITPHVKGLQAMLLAPLAVHPKTQNQGVGGSLIQEGFKRLTQSGVDLVFVLGHPEYYPKFGFQPAGERGFEAPYHIPQKHAGAWMVHELGPGVINRISGKVQCAHALDQPQYWQE